jgi:hypothetical protein
MGKSALVFGAISRDSSAENLSLFREELGQPFDVLVINDGNLLAAEPADFLPKKTGPASPFSIPVPVSVSIIPVSVSRAATARRATAPRPTTSSFHH